MNTIFINANELGCKMLRMYCTLSLQFDIHTWANYLNDDFCLFQARLVRALNSLRLVTNFVAFFSALLSSKIH